MSKFFWTGASFFEYFRSALQYVLTHLPAKRERTSRETKTPSASSVPSIATREILFDHNVDVDPVTGEFCLSGLKKCEAEEVLDWLESAGCQQGELSYLEGKGFIVRWNPPGGGFDKSVG